jgi:hypothetical protein
MRRKINRCKLKGCKKKLHWKARDQEYCSLEHRQQAEGHNDLPGVAIPYDRELTGDPKHDMLADLVDFGRCISHTTPEGTERIDPLSDEAGQLFAENVVIGGVPYRLDENGIRQLHPLTEEDLVAYHNAIHPESPIVAENLTLEEFRKKYPNVNLPLADAEIDRIARLAKGMELDPDKTVMENFRDLAGSPWQGDAPEGTLAHKLKYGEWYKDGHEPS